MSSASRNLLLGAVAAVTAFILLLVILVTATNSNSNSCAMAAGASQPTASSAAQNSIPSNYLELYQKAGQDYGIPWNVLAGIGSVESGHGRNMGPSIAGALGPMQFMPATWNIYGVDGDSDGRRDIMNPADAIPGAAHYLKASGAPGDLRNAIWAYNHSTQYYLAVMAKARQYAAGGYTVAGNNTAGVPCPVGAAGGGQPTLGDINGTVPQRIVAYASKWLGTPYQFGGGDNNGPTVGTNSNGSGKPGFDCSGLTKYAVYQATGGQISLDHYVPNQWDNPHVIKVPYDQLQPGDLIAMHDWGHEGIYIGGGKMIHAPHTGDVVKISDITRGWYRNAFITGGRVT